MMPHAPPLNAGRVPAGISQRETRISFLIVVAASAVLNPPPVELAAARRRVITGADP